MTAVQVGGQKGTMDFVTVTAGMNSIQMCPQGLQGPFQIHEGEGLYFHFHWKVN